MRQMLPQGKNTKILLLKPRSSKSTYSTPDLGMGYLASSLRINGCDVIIIDQQNSRLSLFNLLQCITSFSPNIIGIKVYTRDVQETQRIIIKIKEILPKTTIVLGGPHISCDDPLVSMNYFHLADYALIGEGELSFPALVNSLKNKSLDKNIPGLIYREDGLVLSNEPFFINELDELPFPAWDLITPKHYKFGFHIMTTDLPAAPLLTSRGCPFGCIFCCSHKIMGRNIRRRSVPSVIEEIKLLKSLFGVRTIDIVDENFALSKDYVMNFCDALLKENIDIKWNCPHGIRVDNLDKEIIKRMGEAGCFYFSVGIESGSNRVLEDIKKQTDTVTIYKKLEMIKQESKIKISGHFILGFPDETESEINETIKFALKLPLYYASFYPLLPFPGTYIYQQLLGDKKITPDYFYRISLDIDNPISICSTIDNKRFRFLFIKAWAFFYLRPFAIVNLVRFLFSRTGIILFLRARGKIQYLFRHNKIKDNLVDKR